MHLKGRPQVRVRHDVAMQKNEVVANFNSLCNLAHSIAQIFGVLELNQLYTKTSFLADAMGVSNLISVLFENLSVLAGDHNDFVYIIDCKQLKLKLD